MSRESEKARSSTEWVILLHGMGRLRHSLRRLERHLKGLGYATLNLGYPSTSASIETIAETHLAGAVEHCRAHGAAKIHFVGHSLGGMIVRQYLQNHAVPEDSRLVMLAPPNQGSEIVDLLGSFFLYRWFTGSAGRRLGTGPEDIVHRLKPLAIEVGVIAGNRSINPLFSALLSGANDGTVTVQSTRLPEMRDFIVVPATHTFLMRSPLVLRQVGHFLKHGRFDHADKRLP